MRVGMGYDVHRLTEDRDLILGGVKIPYEKGLLGHSDADAIMDALLGAAALGDIGKHFPDTDPQYKGISSMKLLEHVGRLIDNELYVIGNIDATIIAQRPKMAGTSFNFAFSFATLIACLEISYPYPPVPCTFFKILISTHPEPVHISSTFIPGFTTFSASSTKVSVSCRGISTLEFT